LLIFISSEILHEVNAKLTWWYLTVQSKQYHLTLSSVVW
jgi:hypothetical protein